ncbi:MAG: methylmalonyl Co-A mutase-associated GTPase MeaB [Anaerolineae bacterium]
MDLIEQLLAGQRRALARVISLVEDGQPEAREAVRRLYPLSGRAHVIGVTGAPGAGKSTLVNRLARLYRDRGRRVAVVAVDPSSPFTGGALLGDRVRMRDLAGDQDIFVRSMASRGYLGGLARATAEVVLVLDAAGYDRILVETVGVGQAEVDIARTAHTTVVVEAPGMGDEVQAIKAGILEAGDVFVVSKADREGADRTEAALRMMLEMGRETAPGEPSREAVAWMPPVIRTVATTGEGVEALLDAIEQHRRYLVDSGTWTRRERDRMAFALHEILRDELLERLRSRLAPALWEESLARVVSRSIDPYSAVADLLAASELSW